MKLKLPNSVSSEQDLAALILEIHDYAKWYSHTSIKQRVQNQHEVDQPPTLSAAATDVLHSWGENQPLNQTLLNELITTLENFKNTAPTMTITLAAPAPGDLKQTLVNWCRSNISPSMLVTFKFNSTILGGMVVHYGSRVFDWSFRRQILAGRAKFPEILRRV